MLFRGSRQGALKKDSEVVLDLENLIYSILRKVDADLEEGNLNEAAIKLRYAKNLNQIRGFEPILDKKYDETFKKWCEKLPSSY